MRKTTIVALTAAVALVAMQFGRRERTNPANRGSFSPPASVAQPLRRACFDCHSNETNWPWYSGVAPLSWLIVHDVDEGRRRLNFSEWAEYASDPETQRYKLEQIVRSLRRGDMAPSYYRLLHSAARLTPNERDRIVRWAEEACPTGSPPR